MIQLFNWDISGVTVFFVEKWSHSIVSIQNFWDSLNLAAHKWHALICELRRTRKSSKLQNLNCLFMSFCNIISSTSSHRFKCNCQIKSEPFLLSGA